MKKRKRIFKITLALTVVALCIITVLSGFSIAFWVCDANAYIWSPDYEMLPDGELERLYLTAATEEEFRTLFEQTGLTEIGIERARKRKNGFQTVKAIRDNYFLKREAGNGYAVPFLCTDFIDDEYPASREIYLEKGDILITSSTHLAGFRIGHSGIIARPEYRYPVFQSSQIGQKNGYCDIVSSFTSRINFMIVRIKPEAFGAESGDDEKYTSAIDDALKFITEDLADAKYDPTVGVLSKKDNCKRTQCSHLIWYGFKHFDDKNGGLRNIDLDPNAGMLVTPKDISLSPYVELVQTFGFDPEKMYE